jgi:hypothetical protein
MTWPAVDLFVFLWDFTDKSKPCLDPAWCLGVLAVPTRGLLLLFRGTSLHDGLDDLLFLNQKGAHNPEQPNE